MSVTIFHNPRCSKSRATLDLLLERGFEPIVIDYLKTPPSVPELDRILTMLEMEPRDFMRTKEAAYKESGADDEHLDRESLIELMVENPVLIERPIVVSGDIAVLGRPPESVLEVLF